MSDRGSERFIRKVIARFRYRAGNNGQMFPMRSWRSGFLIVTSSRLILADGPRMMIIPLSSILSLTGERTFPLNKEGMNRMIPLVHSVGLNAYLTLIGVSPVLKGRLTEDLFEILCAFHDEHRLIMDEGEIPVSISCSEEGFILKGEQEKEVLVKSADINDRRMEGTGDGCLIYLDVGDGNDLIISSSATGGKWIDMMLEHYMEKREAPLGDRYRKVLEYLKDHPSTTGALTANLGLVALEGSTILNEMLYLGWVRLDHGSKLYTLTPKGIEILEQSSNHCS